MGLEASLSDGEDIAETVSQAGWREYATYVYSFGIL